jgi:hypothetical protein
LARQAINESQKSTVFGMDRLQLVFQVVSQRPKKRKSTLCNIGVRTLRG